MTNFHKFSGDPKCIPTSQRSFIGHLNDKFFVAKPSYSFDSGFIHSFTETLRNTEKITTLPAMREKWDSPECKGLPQRTQRTTQRSRRNTLKNTGTDSYR